MNSFLLKRQPVKIILMTTTVLLIVLMAGISIVNIATPRNNFTISPLFLGFLGWTTLITSTFYVSFTYKKECLFILFSFFIFGFLSKAYLEPVSDQLNHLYLTHHQICKNIDTGARIDGGLWHYSMNSLFLCENPGKILDPEKKLLNIDILHGLYISFSSAILYSVSRSAGLPAKWSFLSVIIALFFMGTNKFSYFRYYSYGPAFTSHCIYWLWISAFFFSRERRKIIYGILLLIPTIIILTVNHLQGIVFLIFLSFFWIIILLTEKIYHSKKWCRITLLWFFILFSIFFLLPQLKWVQNVFHSFLNVFFPIPIANFWDRNQSIVYYWNNIHIMGKIWLPQHRVPNTLGLMGLAPLVLTPLLFVCNQGNFSKFLQTRIILVGILPFLILCTPLCHYIWAAHVQLPVYYRIVYCSLFWIPIVYFLYLTERCIDNLLNRKFNPNS